MLVTLGLASSTTMGVVASGNEHDQYIFDAPECVIEIRTRSSRHLGRGDDDQATGFALPYPASGLSSRSY
jgi:hypothetical protein